MKKRVLAMLLAVCAMLVFATPAIAAAVDEQPDTLAASAGDVAGEQPTETASDSDRPADVKDTLKIMGQGMIGIFVVMLLIFLVIIILNAASSSAAKKENEERRADK